MKAAIVKTSCCVCQRDLTCAERDLPLCTDCFDALAARKVTRQIPGMLARRWQALQRGRPRVEDGGKLLKARLTLEVYEDTEPELSRAAETG